MNEPKGSAEERRAAERSFWSVTKRIVFAIACGLVVTYFIHAVKDWKGDSDSTSTAVGLQVKADALINAVSHGHARVIGTFAGPDGLLGAVVENSASKQREVAWFSPHADALLDGALLGSHGEDLNREAKIQQGLILSPGEALKQAADPARHSVLVGTGGPLLTVFLDPNCMYCHQFYAALAPEIAGGHVRVRYVIVGTLKASSEPRAASLLGAKDPVQAMALNEQNYVAATEEGGYPIASAIDPALTAVVKGNTTLFGKAGMRGTPTTLYCGKATDTVRLLVGVPTDLKAFITQAGTCA